MADFLLLLGRLNLAVGAAIIAVYLLRRPLRTQFGAPIAYDDHAKWACRCALQSLKKLGDLNVEYAKKGLPGIDIGIGLNTGTARVGNTGTIRKFKYGPLGHAKNTSRTRFGTISGLLARKRALWLLFVLESRPAIETRGALKC